MNTATKEKVKLYRMSTPEHECPWGLKAVNLLNEKGIEFEDHKLRSKEETEAFKAKHNVQTTPQIFFGDERIGGYTDLAEKLDVEAEKLCKEWGIDGSVYCHSTGIPGHGIGASILNNWPDRYGVRATYPLRLGAYYAIESHAISPVPEWGGQRISIATEEDAYLTKDGFAYFVPRQERIILIK